MQKTRTDQEPCRPAYTALAVSAIEVFAVEELTAKCCQEKAQDFFLRQMMTAEGEERERAECIYIQLIHGLDECSDED